MQTSYDLLDLPSPLVVSDVSKQQFENELQSLAKPIVFKAFWKDKALLDALTSPTQAANYLLNSLADKQAKMTLTRIPFSEKSRMFYDEQFTAMNFGVASLSAQQCFMRMTSPDRDADYAVQCVPINQYMPSLHDKLQTLW